MQTQFSDDLLTYKSIAGALDRVMTQMNSCGIALDRLSGEKVLAGAPQQRLQTAFLDVHRAHQAILSLAEQAA